MPDVTIPADVAKQVAEFLRSTDGHPDDNAAAERWADLLDPPPASLREQVADCLVGLPEVRAHQAGLVLAVVADWLAAQPLTHSLAYAPTQRDADVALIRGGAES